MADNMPICPLTLIDSDRACPCIRANCAWWIGDGELCSVAAVGCIVIGIWRGFVKSQEVPHT